MTIFFLFTYLQEKESSKKYICSVNIPQVQVINEGSHPSLYNFSVSTFCTILKPQLMRQKVRGPLRYLALSPASFSGEHYFDYLSSVSVAVGLMSYFHYKRNCAAINLHCASPFLWQVQFKILENLLSLLLSALNRT